MAYFCSSNRRHLKHKTVNDFGTNKDILMKFDVDDHNDRQNLSFVRHTYGEKMAREGRTKVIYKGTFILKQSLLPNYC